MLSGDVVGIETILTLDVGQGGAVARRLLGFKPRRTAAHRSRLHASIQLAIAWFPENKCWELNVISRDGGEPQPGKGIWDPVRTSTLIHPRRPLSTQKYLTEWVPRHGSWPTCFPKRNMLGRQ
jgi:hypothetical protein